MSIFSRAKRTFKSAVSKVKSGASKIASVAKNSFAAVVNPIKNSAGVSTLPKSQPNYKGLNNVEKDAYTPTDYSKDILSTGLKSGGLKLISTGSTGGLYQPSRRSSQSNGTSLSSSSLSSPGLNSYGGPSQTPSTKTISAGGRSSSSSGLSTFSNGTNPSIKFGGATPSNSFSIGSSSVSSAPSVSVPSAPSYTNVSPVSNAGLTSALDSTQAYDPASGLIVPAPTDTTAASDAEKRKKDFEDLMDMQPTKDSVYDDREVKRQQQEVRDRQQEVNNYTAQLNNIVAKQNADLLNLRGIGAAEGVTETVYGGQAATINREAAIKALPIQAQVAAAQGNLDLAQDYLSELIMIKKDQIDADFEYNMTRFEALSGFLTKEEKIRMDKMTKDEERAYDQAQNNLDLQNEWSKTAITNGQNHLVSRINALSVGDPNFQEKLGQIVAGIQDKDAGAGTSETVQTYANLLAQGKISLSNVPQSIRNAVVLASNGIVNKPLSDGAIKEITQTQSAIENLGALRNVVQNNLQFIGPISGLARYNPYSDARQAQAEVDRVRQVVGKALEGGVLRKEDEEKYKKILATLSDTPETAIYKIDSLIGQLERDLSLYQENQSQSGRYVGETNVPDLDTLRAKYGY